jgi:hypothetical protein
METGWSTPDAAPVMPVSQFMMAMRADPDRDRTLSEVLTDHANRGRGGKPEASDQDAQVTTLLARGYRPGMTLALHQRLAEVEAALAGEHEMTAKAERVAGHVRRDQESGRLSALEAAQLLPSGGDLKVIERLEHEAASLRQQLGDAHEVSCDPRQQRDPIRWRLPRHELIRRSSRQPARCWPRPRPGSR